MSSSQVDLSQGTLLFHKMQDYPIWPIRAMSWDPFDKTDPAQCRTPDGSENTTNYYEYPDKKKEREVLILYLGKDADFATENRSSNRFLSWNELKDDLKAWVDGNLDDKGLKEKHKAKIAGEDYFQGLKSNSELYKAALEDAFEYSEKRDDRQWLWNSDYSKKYGYWAEWEESKKAEFEARSRAQGDSKAALKAMAEKKRKLAQVKEEEEVKKEEENVAYTSSGRRVKPRADGDAWDTTGVDDGAPPQDDGDYQHEEKRKKKQKVAEKPPQKSAKPKPVAVASPSASKPPAQGGGKKRKTRAEWTSFFGMVKDIVTGSNFEKKPKYQMELLEMYDELATDYRQRAEDLEQRIRRLTEKKRECERELEAMSADLRVVTTSMVNSKNDYTRKQLGEHNLPKFAKRIGKNQYLTTLAASKVVCGHMKDLFVYWKRKFSANQQEQAKQAITLSPRAGDFDRETATNLTCLILGSAGYDTAFGQKIEEEIFSRHGLEGKEAYKRDFKRVHAAVKQNSDLKDLMPRVERNEITLKELVDQLMTAQTATA